MYRRELGFSLLEFFIALIIGLIILAGLLNIFLVSKRTATLESAFAQVQENGRFIQAYVQNIIRLAGYRSVPTSATIFSPISNVFSGANNYIGGSTGTGVNNSDTLIISYQGSGNGIGTPDGTIRDCLGSSVDANTIAINTFSINNNYQFQCQAVNPNATPATSTQVLISGVEAFKVLYGEDVDGDHVANRYVPANYPFLNINNVVSLRVYLVLRSEQQVNTYSEQPTFYLGGSTFTPGAPDQYFRRELIFTVLLRNVYANSV